MAFSHNQTIYTFFFFRNTHLLKFSFNYRDLKIKILLIVKNFVFLWRVGAFEFWRVWHQLIQGRVDAFPKHKNFLTFYVILNALFYSCTIINCDIVPFSVIKPKFWNLYEQIKCLFKNFDQFSVYCNYHSFSSKKV